METYNKYTRRVRGKNMKIMKSNFIKKLIIILVIIMVLNTLLPDPVNAGLLATIAEYAGGVLFKPLAILIATTLASIDVFISAVLNGNSWRIDTGTLYEKADDVLRTFLVGPDTIFSGKVDMLNANIFRSGMTGTMAHVKNAVARIYYLLRNICGFIMLGGLIFTGIRILLSSNIPTKKTQYLILLQDWLIGMVLLVLSHVLMAGIFYISDAIVNGLSISITDFGGLNYSCLEKVLSITNWKYSSLVIHLILLGYLIWMTVVFAISYFKRFLWICVLVVFAPVFAVMYSFGQQTKQIYSRWMREFCLTVFVQPFHMIIYSVLVGIPMNIVGLSLSSSAFDLFYALMAISMIRPAEKYMRQLFGMDKGIANMASYDSGKQVITDTAKAIGKVAKTAVAVGTTIGTAGAVGAMGAGGALGSQGAAGALGAAGEDPSGASDALSGPGDALGEIGSGEEDKPPQWISEDWEKDEQGRYFNPYNEEWYTEDELNSGRDLPAYMEDKDDFDSADIQALTSGITDGLENQTENEKTEETYVGPAEFMKSLRENSEAKDENMTDNDVAKAVGSENVAKMLEDAGFSGEEIASYLGTGNENAEGLSGGNINASNVTINASSVNMEGATLESAQSQLQVGEGTISEEGNTTSGDTQDSSEGNTTSGDTQNSSEDDGISLEGSSEKINFWDAFKNQGGLEQLGTLANDLVDGHHSIAAGLYVDGTAPTGEWNANSQWRRQNIAEAGKKREENVRRSADNWANNKANISIMAGKYIDDERKKAQKKYGKSKDADYIESVAQEQAKTKAKAALKDMSVYVQYGVTDVNTAYKLYENANDNGFKPDESIRNMAGFNKFNTNAGNVNNINVSNNYTGNNYTTVEQAIPNAKTYYDAGYTDIKDMSWVDYMAQRLGKSPEFAMAVDETLKKKGKEGKLTYNGKDADMKKVIDQINSHYGG